MVIFPLEPDPKVNIYHVTIFESIDTLAIIKFRFVGQFDSK